MSEDQNPADPVGDDDVRTDNDANALPDQVEQEDAATADADAPDDGAAEPEAETKPDASAGDKTPPAEDEKSRSALRRERRKQHLAETEERLRKAEESLTAIRLASDGTEAPKESDFDDYTDYAAAKAVWAYNSSSRKAQASQVETQHEAAKAERDAAIRAGWQEQVEAAKATYKDFEAVAYNNEVPITAAMGEVIMSSDVGAELAYYLGSNRSESARIAAMSPLAAAKELGRIEANISAPKPRTATKAPPPVKPVKPNAGTGEKAPSEMSYQQYRRWRAEG